MIRQGSRPPWPATEPADLCEHLTVLDELCEDCGSWLRLVEPDDDVVGAELDADAPGEGDVY